MGSADPLPRSKGIEMPAEGLSMRKIREVLRLRLKSPAVEVGDYASQTRITLNSIARDNSFGHPFDRELLSKTEIQSLSSISRRLMAHLARLLRAACTGLPSTLPCSPAAPLLASTLGMSIS